MNQKISLILGALISYVSSYKYAKMKNGRENTDDDLVVIPLDISKTKKPLNYSTYSQHRLSNQEDDFENNDDGNEGEIDYLSSSSSGCFPKPTNVLNSIRRHRANNPQIFTFLITFVVCCVPFILTTIILSLRGPSITNSKTFSSYPSYYITSQIAAVASDVGICSDMGVNILKSGGNAMDAAVTTTLCLGVMSPASSGIGGGCYIVSYNASTGSSEFIDSREVAPLASTPTMFDSDPLASQNGALAIAVVAELKGLYLGWKKFGSGSLSWKQLVQPVVNIAGAAVISRELALLMKEVENDLATGNYPGLAALLLDGAGNLKKEGDTLYRPQLAKTLQAVADHGPDYVYKTMAGTIASEIQALGGIITEAEIQAYEPVIHEPIRTTVFGGYTYIGASGSSSGAVAVTGLLKFLSSYADPMVSQSYLYYHRLAEAMKHVFAIRMSLGDPAFVNTTGPIHALLSDSYMSQLRRVTSDKSVLPLDQYGGRYNYTAQPLPRIDHGTSHLSIIDSWGNAIALTSTINTYFGSKVVSPSLGIIWNNQMDDFSNDNSSNFFKLAPNYNNFPEPGKKPLSSMSPSILLSPTGKVRLVGGASGGPRIITGTAQMILNSIGRGMDLLTAVTSPRIHTQLFPNTLCVENHTYVSEVDLLLPAGIQKFLTDRGQNVIECSGFSNTQFIGKYFIPLVYHIY